MIHYVDITGYLSVEKYFSQSDTARNTNPNPTLPEILLPIRHCQKYFSQSDNITLYQITIFVRELYGY